MLMFDVRSESLTEILERMERVTTRIKPVAGG